METIEKEQDILDKFSFAEKYLLENSLIFCPQHKKQMQFLYIDFDQKKDNQIFKCSSCFIKEKISSDFLLPMSDILTCDDSTILDNWPLNDMGQRCSEIQNLKNPFNQEMRERVDDNFKQFRSTMIQYIDDMQDQFLKRLEEINQNYIDLKENYNQMSFKNELKQLIINYQCDSEQSVKDYYDLIDKLSEEEEQNQMLLDRYLENINHYESYLSIENLKEIQNKIEFSMKSMLNIISYQVLQESEENNNTQLQDRDNFNPEIYFGQIQKLQSKNQILDHRNSFDQIQKTDLYKKGGKNYTYTLTNDYYGLDDLPKYYFKEIVKQMYPQIVR